MTRNELINKGWEILEDYPHADRSIFCKPSGGIYLFCDLWKGKMRIITRERKNEIVEGNWQQGIARVKFF